MQNLSQRNPAWSSKKLGSGDTNKSTIGSHGCTITSLSMAAGLTPDDTNDRLNKVGGYAASSDAPKTFNLINWQLIDEAISWMKFEWRGYAYENERVSAAIAKNGFCLVAVDGSKIGGGKKDGHWVLYIGGQKMVDPWDGQEKPTSHYPPTGYAIINKVGNPPASGPEAPKTVAVETKTFETLVRNSTQWGKTSTEYVPDRDPSTTNFEDVQRVVNGYKSRVTDVEKQRDQANSGKAIAEQEVLNQKDKLANVEAACQRTIELKNAEISALKTTGNSVEKLRGEYVAQIASLETDLREAQKQGGIKDSRIVELQTQLDAANKPGPKPPLPQWDLAAVVKSITDFLANLFRQR